MFHPYRQIPSGWQLDVRPLDGALGFTDHYSKVIYLDAALGQAERRSTLAHELHHVRRGSVGAAYVAREERAVELAAAHDLITREALCEALRWTHCVEELAELLWVDCDTVLVRLESLSPEERGWIQSRLVRGGSIENWPVDIDWPVS